MEVVQNLAMSIKEVILAACRPAGVRLSFFLFVFFLFVLCLCALLFSCSLFFWKPSSFPFVFFFSIFFGNQSFILFFESCLTFSLCWLTFFHFFSPLLSPLLPAPPLSSILLIPLSPAARCLRAALSRARPTYTVRVKQGHLVLWEQIASQSEVNRAIFLELVRPLEVRRGIVQCLLGDGGHLQPARMLAQPKR